jgi:vacuolar-type H+-ATPase subunit I/STV1
VVLRLTVARIEVLVWLLIYGGMLVIAVGFALRELHSLLAPAFGVTGLALIALGAALVWLRSRRVARPPAPSQPPAPASSHTE